jgi:uncharacterized Zn finger protein (UPF0148 family)
MSDQTQTETDVAIQTKATEQPLSIREQIKTGEVFTIATPEGLITDTGVRELQAYLYDIGGGDLPPDFEPVWMGKRGTLPKRMQAHVYKSRGLRLTTEQVSNIGNIAKRHTATAQTYVFDFTKTIDWHAGDFGDDGSCFWGDKSGAKQMIEENGFAVRFYHKRNSGGGEERGNLRGYARAWLAPISENRLIVFNGYGETSLTIARVLSVRFACGYKRISLLNNGTDGGCLWINGGSSYLLGDWGKINDVESWDLQWDDIDAEEGIVCHVCDCDLDEDDATHAHNRYGEIVPCCDGCTFTCYRCDDTFTEDCQRRHEGESYCRGCHEDVVQEEARKAQERAEERERLEKKRDDCQTIVEDLEEQLQEAKDDLESVTDRLEELETEAD